MHFGFYTVESTVKDDDDYFTPQQVGLYPLRGKQQRWWVGSIVSRKLAEDTLPATKL